MDKGVHVKAQKAVVTLVEQCCKVGDDTSMVGDTAVHNLMDHIRANLPDYIDYFTNHVTSTLVINMDVLRRHG